MKKRGEAKAKEQRECGSLTFISVTIQSAKDITNIVGEENTVVVSLHACGALSSKHIIFVLFVSFLRDF
jgi:hypothetical protein